MINENSSRDEVLEAVKQHKDALFWASNELRGDREVVLEAVKQNVFALQFASQELLENQEIVLAADCDHQKPSVLSL